MFHFFVLASVVVNQKTSTETDVISKIEIDSTLQTKLVFKVVEIIIQ